VAALLEVTGLRKSFGCGASLRDGQFGLEANIVHALSGGLGAGKSAFLSILWAFIGAKEGRSGATAEVEFNNGKTPGTEPAGKPPAPHALALEPNPQILDDIVDHCCDACKTSRIRSPA
jgi:hypothetical protein